MLKLIIKLPQDLDAKLLMTSALALAYYKERRRTSNEYGDFDEELFEPEHVRGDEYEVDASVLDPYLMERLAELQKIVPFEMYFENRGKYDAATWMYKHPDWTGDIEDAALYTLFWQGAEHLEEAIA